MPYKLRKAPKRDLYWVVGEDGKHHSGEPLPKARAEAQMRALYAAMPKEGGGFDDVFGTRPGSVPVQTTNDPAQMAKWEAEGDAALHARQAAAQAAIQQKLDDETREGWKQTFGIMGDVFNSVGGLTKLIPGAGAVLSPIANTIGNLYKLGSGHMEGGGEAERSALLKRTKDLVKDTIRGLANSPGMRKLIDSVGKRTISIEMANPRTLHAREQINRALYHLVNMDEEKLKAGLLLPGLKGIDILRLKQNHIQMAD